MRAFCLFQKAGHKNNNGLSHKWCLRQAHDIHIFTAVPNAVPVYFQRKSYTVQDECFFAEHIVQYQFPRDSTKQLKDSEFCLANRLKAPII